MQNSQNNIFQIIAGKYRGRKFGFADTKELRPTPNKVRETLFNWLQFELTNKRCLDLFAGSGALGFEAISRGAKSVLSVEKNLDVYQSLEKNQRLLNLQQLQLVHFDALEFLTEKNQQYFDFVFIDPPFNQNFIPKTLNALVKENFVTSGSKIYIESEYKILLAEISSLFLTKINILKQKQSGQVHYCLVEIL